MSYEFKLGKYYNLSTTVPSILGESFIRLKFCGKVNYSIAKMMEMVDIKHRQLYPHIPGIIDDPSTFEYFVFEGTDKSRMILAEPWINMTSIVEVASTVINILIEDIATSDIEIIRQMLLASGYSNFKMTAI